MPMSMASVSADGIHFFDAIINDSIENDDQYVSRLLVCPKDNTALQWRPMAAWFVVARTLKTKTMRKKKSLVCVCVCGVGSPRAASDDS